MAFTAGIAPISDPRYALVVLINDPKAGEYYGGAVSAPVFSNIMGYALRANAIPQDAEPVEKQQLKAQNVLYMLVITRIKK